MPNKDGTGPEGKGPRTGRGLGPCAEGNEKKAVRRGAGFGRGRGRGAGNGRREGR